MQEISERARNDDSAEVLLKMKMGRVGRRRREEREKGDRSGSDSPNKLAVDSARLSEGENETHARGEVS